MANEEYNMKKEVKKLQAVRGSGTELITVYVPPKFPISEMTGKLKEEYGQASNIKSKGTRTNVQSAIDKIVQHLKSYRETPKNGLAVFCGNLGKQEGKSDIQLFSIEPPSPLKVNLYRCDSTFMLEPLIEILDAKESYVLLIMDGHDATVAVLKGTSIKVEKRVRSFAQPKVKKGGQSAARYERGSEEAINDYYNNIGYAINEVFQKNEFKIKGVIVGGPGPTKENFAKSGKLNYQIKILGVFDTGYTDEEMGVRELLEKSKDMLAEQEAIKENKIMERFLGEVGRNGAATYGFLNVLKEINRNNVERVIVSEEFEIEEVTYKCGGCGKEVKSLETTPERKEKHEECGGNMQFIEAKDALLELIEKAEEKNIEVSFISLTSQYGKELFMGFKGVGAILRYKN